MIKNFFKVVLRNAWRQKQYVLINVIGLGIGIAAMVWGYQAFRFSMSFDDFHPDRDNVYRALTFKDGAEGVKGIFPLPVVHAAQKDFPAISGSVLLDSRALTVKTEKGEPFIEHVHFSDPSFFNFFDFPLVAGDQKINDLSAVLITEKIAKKYFGNQDPIGKIMIFYAGESYSMPLFVKGVLKNPPVNSTIQFNILTNFDNQLKPDGTKIRPDDWEWFVDAAFFKIPNPADAAGLSQSLKKYLSVQNKAREDWKVSGFNLISLRKSALQSDYIDTNSLYERPEDSATYGPFALAFLIFLSACLNFSNTTVARSNQRLKEIGIRKVMGSTHIQLIMQLLMECALIVLAAIALSVLFNSWWLPVFNKMFEHFEVHADYLHDMSLLYFLGAMLIITALLAGLYPAFYISRFNPSRIFRGTVKFGGTNLFSRLMLGMQLSIAIITVIAGLAFARNSEFQRNYDFGYDMKNTMGVVVNNPNSFNALKNELSALPEIKGIAGTRNHLGYGFRSVVAESEGIKKETSFLEVGRNYLEVMNLRMAVGRAFDPRMESDHLNALLITQKLVGMYGWKDREALGKQVLIDTIFYTVIGVLKDFHPEYLFDPPAPVAMKLTKEDRFQFLIIKANATDLTKVHAKTKDAWKKLFPLIPFNGFYQNEVTAEAYSVSNSIAKIFSWFAIVCILLTATGLFALVSLTVMKKMKEIALRKVVGAGSKHILILINRGYFWIFLVSAILGCYGGWALTNLLMGMIFKVNVGVANTTLVASVIALFAIGLITTGIKVYQAIRTNPVKLLRTE